MLWLVILGTHINDLHWNSNRKGLQYKVTGEARESLNNECNKYFIDKPLHRACLSDPDYVSDATHAGLPPVLYRRGSCLFRFGEWNWNNLLKVIMDLAKYVEYDKQVALIPWSQCSWKIVVIETFMKTRRVVDKKIEVF